MALRCLLGFIAIAAFYLSALDNNVMADFKHVPELEHVEGATASKGKIEESGEGQEGESGQNGSGGAWFKPLGAVVRVTPRIKIRTVYDSNVDNKGFDDIQVVSRPSLIADLRTDTVKAQAHGDFVWREFVHHDDLDRADWFSGLNVDWTATEKLNLGFKVEQAHDHMVDWAAESFASDIEAIKRDSVTATPSFLWQITELDGFAVSYSFRHDDYDRADKYDFNDNTLNMYWIRNLGERTNFSLGVMGRFTQYFTEISQNDYQANSFLMAGFDHNLYEDMKIIFSAGIGLTYSDYTTLELQPDYTYTEKTGTDLVTSYVMEAKLAWRSENFELIPSISRTLQPSFYGEDMTVNQFKLYYRYRLTERSAMNFAGMFTIADSAGHIQKRHNEGYFLQGSVNYMIIEDLKVEVGGNFNHNWNRSESQLGIVSHKTNERFRGWVGLSYEFPMQLMP